MIVPVIPGLTFEHFAIYKDDNENNDGRNDNSNNNVVLTRIPRLQSAKVKKGAFCFQWDAKQVSTSSSVPKTPDKKKYVSLLPPTPPPPPPPPPPMTTPKTCNKNKAASPTTAKPSSTIVIPALSPSASDVSSSSSSSEVSSLSSTTTPKKPKLYYKLFAKGNILKCQTVMGLRQWWGFKCRCTCPNFQKAERATIESGETTHYVCEHLHAALLSVIDTEGFTIDPPAECFIPGLTSQHFVYNNDNSSDEKEEDEDTTANNDGDDNNNDDEDAATTTTANSTICSSSTITTTSSLNNVPKQPILKRAHIDTEGYFHFIWETIGSRIDGTIEKSYELGAHGDIRNIPIKKRNTILDDDDSNDSKKDEERTEEDNYWWGFETYCTCSNFKEQYHRRGRRNHCQNATNNKQKQPQHYVCKHLAMALESAIDPDAQLAYEMSTKYNNNNKDNTIIVEDNDDINSIEENDKKHDSSNNNNNNNNKDQRKKRKNKKKQWRRYRHREVKTKPSAMVEI